MAGASREQALSLLSAVKNHGDLAVKLSSLRQARDILLSMEPSFAAELFPYLVELQSSPESLVRKILLELAEELGLKVMEQSSILMPVFLTLLNDDASFVVRQSIVSGTNFFCSVLEEMALQFHRTGKVERWLEELWIWMIKFKDAICGITLESGPVGTKLLAIKFLEMYVLLFTSDANDSETSVKEVKGRNFNISWVVGGHPILDPALLTLEANRSLGLLLDLLRSARTLSGAVTITVINCLAAIARKRPLHYSTILSALLGFDPNYETPNGGHAASIHYSFRTAFLGFLRCTHPSIIESRDRLLRALRAMNAGDAADQVIRKVDKIIKNTDRASRDARFNKEDQLSSQLPVSGELSKKRSMLQDIEGPVNNDELPAKRTRYVPVGNSTLQVQNDSGQDEITLNGVSSKVPLLHGGLTPVEQMIAMIGALLAEGERGAESLEILISKIQPDLMADIVIANMKHLPKNSPPLSSRLGNMPMPPQICSTSISTPSQVTAPSVPTTSQQSPVLTSQAASPFSSAISMGTSSVDLASVSTLPADFKRDPRRDPRRLDPRRAPVPAAVQPLSVKDDIGDIPSGFDGPISLDSPLSVPLVSKVENASEPLMCKSDMEFSESSVIPLNDQLTTKENLEAEVVDEAMEIDPSLEVNTTADVTPSPEIIMDLDPVVPTQSDFTAMEEDASYVLEFDQHSPVVSSTSASEDTSHDLPMIPLYIELTGEQQNCVSKLAVERIIESSKQMQATGCSQTCMELLARLVLQTGADDDIVTMVQKHIILDYQHQKGHELAMHVLYHLRTVVVSCSDEFSSSAASIYEKFLLAVAKTLRDTLPASDKSFSRFLGEVPLLPGSALKLLEDLCCSDGFDNLGKDVHDGDRVTQGLGAVWSLILGRPLNRKACLDIAFKCAVHAQDDVRAKAIRLVANKLYPLSYASEIVEEFATNMLLSVVDQRVPDTELSQAGFSELKPEENVGGQETSISGSQNSDPGVSESESTKGIQPVLQSVPTVSLSQAQRCMSLFFALCTKKPSLLQLVFDIYGRAPKTVKQAVHRHIPNLVRNLGSSFSEFLRIISDPPQGSENLLMLVLQILTEETTPSADLIATVKHLYYTKLKDAAILIPMLSSLSKDEVLPIFPRLVGLPLEKFQTALARILQGSAHTGPALSPAEVLVAIHDITPERDGIALKKITDACSACFEQRTVFTQQVLAKALNQLVDQTPLPLLFMRTVIQAIDAFPTLVDFVMEILSKLVSKQIWKMPKLWVGFLKCASQTQPHSFRVLLQLPPPQLESALNRHANLRGPLASHANQPSIRSSLPSTRCNGRSAILFTHMRRLGEVGVQVKRTSPRIRPFSQVLEAKGA
ncbi:HEAT [Macleaya cordata]|uniref:HEAT n=1 Tax=Macleaya cordata TaxID=56857 RepID=A0A200QA60_MACCD|nr:HEAT [Macleaya cordata]